ncbi:MAG: GFA family protein [Burkholderiales bacterium]
MVATHCYCRDCQRLSGGAMTSNVGVPAATFRVTKGEPKTYERTADNGNKILRRFCARCGSPLFVTSAAFAEVVVLSVGSLDDPSIFVPMVILYLARAPKWAPVTRELPWFETMPER